MQGLGATTRRPSAYTVRSSGSRCACERGRGAPVVVLHDGPAWQIGVVGQHVDAHLRGEAGDQRRSSGRRATSGAAARRDRSEIAPGRVAVGRAPGCSGCLGGPAWSPACGPCAGPWEGAPAEGAPTPAASARSAAPPAPPRPPRRPLRRPPPPRRSSTRLPHRSTRPAARATAAPAARASPPPSRPSRAAAARASACRDGSTPAPTLPPAPWHAPRAAAGLGRGGRWWGDGV